jgi:hypothetical protein
VCQSHHCTSVSKGVCASINQHIPNVQHQHASTINNNYYYNVNVHPADMNGAYTAAFATPFQFGIQGIQYGIQGGQYSQCGQYGQYGQDGQLHNVKIQGSRKRKCWACGEYGCKGANNRNNCENKKI